MRAIAERPARSRKQAEQPRQHLLVAVLCTFSDATPWMRLFVLSTCLGFVICMALIVTLWVPSNVLVSGGGVAWLIGRLLGR